MISHLSHRLLLSLGLITLVSQSMAAEPLLQEGKKTLYQRVLSTPTCELMDKAGDKKGKKIPTFSRYYVYQRQNIQNSEWLKVGPDSFGKTIGWLDSQCAVPWNMQMTLAFTKAIDRDRLLFFKDKATLEKILDNSDPGQAVAHYREDLKNNKNNPDILAQEPEEYVDFQKNFYLLPILQGEEIMNGQGFYQRILEVASVSKNSPKDTKNNKASQQVTEFSAAVVFVIDSTISMDPYINRTREAMKKIYEHLEKKRLGNHVKFGLVAFRSSTKAVPGLEYVSKMFVDPNTVKGGQDFLNKIANLQQAKVSSKEFSEDSYAGINSAIRDVDWSSFGARYIVLITDAGAIDGNNTLSSTGLDAKQLRLEAADKGIAIYALHLKTPAGAKNHKTAEQQYSDLSFNNYLNKSLYYAVNAGDVNQFGNMVDNLGKAISKQVSLAYQGEMAAGSALGAKDDPADKKDNSQSDIEKDAELLGKAMQLTYLGNTVKGNTAPPVFKAWISDKDFANAQTSTAEARVLLTKSQLSDLSDVVKKIADAANSGLISPSDMFTQLRSVAAAMGQDPNKLKQNSSTKIADLGLLGEYLDGIPYKSQVTGIDEETWKGMSAQEQEKFVRELNSKLRHYRLYNEDQARWIPLSEGSDSRDFVYPVPLEALP